MNEFSLIQSTFEVNRTVYIRGISRTTTISDIINHFSIVGDITASDIYHHPINKGIIYIQYKSEDDAKMACSTLNRTELNLIILTVRPYKETTSTSSSSGSSSSSSSSSSSNDNSQMHYITRDPIIQRKVKDQSKYYGKNNKKNSDSIDITYTNTGIMIDHNEYPMPTGKYIMQLLHISSLCIEDNKQIIRTLLNTNNTSKEITESFAMFNGLQTLLKKQRINTNDITNANVYVIGDGIIPFTSMILSLLLPYNFLIHSIDPILDFDISTLGNNQNTKRIKIIKKMSQDYVITDSNDSDENSISIVIACHSHAPLEEFWNRLSTSRRRLAVSLPCCGKYWSIMKHVSPIMEYDDYEIFSPRRRVYLYSSPIMNNDAL